MYIVMYIVINDIYIEFLEYIRSIGHSYRRFAKSSYSSGAQAAGRAGACSEFWCGGRIYAIP